MRVKLLLVLLHVDLDRGLLVAELLLLFEFLQEFSDRVVHGDSQRNLVLRALTFLFLLLHVADLTEDYLKKKREEDDIFMHEGLWDIHRLLEEKKKKKKRVPYGFLGKLRLHSILKRFSLELTLKSSS